MKTTLKIAVLSMLMILLCSSSVQTNTTAVTASAGSEDTVIIGGEPFGIKLYCDGVLVIKTEDVKTDSGEVCPAGIAGIRANDVILTANGEFLESNDSLAQVIESSNGDAVTLKLTREDKYITATLFPKKNTNGEYKAGMWIRDSAAGIGTITYYDTKNMSFACLGHGICDYDTSYLLPISSGEISGAGVSTVTKSSNGAVGTLNGYFTNEIIGNAKINSNMGVYGDLKAVPNKDKEIAIAEISEISIGKAYIYTTVSGCVPDLYEVHITNISKNDEKTNMIIKITDERLLQTCGGIVQGMSGSPIIQNGKLAGAVTHVIVDRVCYGYGIFAQNMYEVYSASGH